MGKGYEDLEVWQKARKIASEIYLITKEFPQEDRYSFVSQIRKSSLSIASNIAEGATRNSKKEFIQFISYAHGSCSELRTQLLISSDVKIIANDAFVKLDNELQNIGKMLKGLQRSLEKQHTT